MISTEQRSDLLKFGIDHIFPTILPETANRKMVVPLYQFCQFWWREVFKKVKMAVVFIDNPASECLHWNGDVVGLFSAGAVSVKEFSSFECGTNSQKKAVFITCGPIHTTTRTILRDIIQASSFEYCVLITAAHPSVHQLAKYGTRRETSNDMAAFHGLEEDMLQWMGNMGTGEKGVPATETLFLTPPFSELFPLVDCDLVHVREQYQLLHRGADASHLTSLSSLELSSLPPELQVPAHHLVSCLHSLLAQWDMREDLYSLGHFSGLLAAQLEALPAANNRRKVSIAQPEALPAANNRHKVSIAKLEALLAANNRHKVSIAKLEALPASNNRHKVSTAKLKALLVANNRYKSASNACSLILVDRTLDLCSATRHDSDSVLDRILAVLPRLPGHSNDVAVNMSPICSAKTETAITDNLIPPGCLSQPNSEQCLQIYESLVSKRQKDVLLSLHQHLAAVTPSSREERGPKLATRVTPMTLDKQVGSFKNHSDKIAQCAGLLQQTLAVTQTLRSPRIAQLEVIVSVEKLLLQNLGTSRDGAVVLAQMTQLIKTRRERNLPLEDLLVVLVHLYSLAGTDITFSSQAEMLVQSAVQAALFQDRETLEGFLSTLDPHRKRGQCCKTFTIIRGCRVKLKVHGDSSQLRVTPPPLSARSLFESRGSSQPAAHTGLLRQLVADLLDPTRPELPDLACKSAGLKELLKTGFSLLLNMPRQQHPLDHPMVVIFVVGGITAQEVRLIQEAVADSGLATKVLVGSTRLITPLDTARALFQAHTA
uniref:Sec1 family domain-containing protein 2 n=1 Tax=Timema bartmani TaxID=61472 RepID=A0A7R9F113_9NEOP|nr:unnamed protein product [Timema bartmani]